MTQKNLIMVSFGVIVVLFLVTFFLTQSPENNEVMQNYQSGEVTEVEPAEEETVDSSNKPQAKINVQAVCEGALAYTTFTDGAAADAYVAECIEGKYPDVIDRYIESLNLGEGIAI